MADRETQFLAVEAAYDRWSGFYDRYDNPLVFVADAALRCAIPDASGRSIVEFGCGTGRNLAYLRSRGASHVVGLDLSAGMLERAKARHVADDLLIHDMSIGEAPAVPACDLALFVLSLEHFASLTGPLRQALGLLRPGGEIIVIEIHPYLSFRGAKAHFVDGNKQVEMPAYAHQFADYLTAFSKLGLVICRCREWRPSDISGALPAKVLKRGVDMPMVVAYHLKPTAE